MASVGPKVHTGIGVGPGPVGASLGYILGGGSLQLPPYKALWVEGLINFYLGFAPQAENFWAFFLKALGRQSK